MGKGRGDYCCSFCGKPREDVQRLIAGPDGVFICDQCVHLCNEILAGDATAAAGRPHGRGLRCWLQSQLRVAHLVAGG